MITGSGSDRKRPLSWFLHRIGMISLGVLSANGQQADQLQQQLQQLKQQYDTTTRDLEQRIATLELEIEKQKEATAKEREARSEEHTSELQSRQYLVCRLLLE